MNGYELFAVGFLTATVVYALLYAFLSFTNPSSRLEEARLNNDQVTFGQWKYRFGHVTAPDAFDSRGENGSSIDGPVVCKSVSKPDGLLIAAAPELLRVLKGWQQFNLGQSAVSQEDLLSDTDAAIRNAIGQVNN